VSPVVMFCSVGRVQTGVLSAVAARNKEIASFVPVPYYELEAAVSSLPGGASIKAWLVNPETGRTAFPKQEGYLQEAKAFCGSKPPLAAETKVSRKTEKPEKLLNITGLQKAAYRLHGYSPEKTLELAQSLYETRKCLSYPRTPSRVMGDNNAELFLEKFKALSPSFPELSKLCDPALITSSNRHIFNSAALEDHHALIPLAPLPEDASEQERNVFNIAARSFFMVCMPDYVYDQKTLLFHAGQYTLKSSVRDVVQAGWKAAVGAAKKEKEE